LAASLAAEKNVEIVVIPDAAIFAMMSRVNKVIIGTHSVLANGGLRAACGAYTVALAAKHYSVPVIVLAPMYKLSPLHLCEQDAFNMVGCAEDVIPYDSIPAREAKVYSPMFDYVPPELVTLFISNTYVVILLYIAAFQWIYYTIYDISLQRWPRPLLCVPATHGTVSSRRPGNLRSCLSPYVYENRLIKVDPEIFRNRPFPNKFISFVIVNIYKLILNSPLHSKVNAYFTEQQWLQIVSDLTILNRCLGFI